jgi:PPIC-type PPIASE domain
MSSSPGDQSAALQLQAAEPARRALGVRRMWTRLSGEPLLHFVALGGLVFALQWALSARAPRDGTIQVAPQTRRELAALFTQRQQRAPDAREIETLVARWIDDEVLFREGLRLELPRQDPALRDQVIARMRTLLQASLQVPPASEVELRAFQRAHRARYRDPSTVSFVEYLVPAGPDAEDQARALWRALTRGDHVLQAPSVQRRRSESQLAELYGPELARRIVSLEPDQLQQLRSARGIYLLKLEERTPAREPSFEELRERLIADLRSERTQRAFREELARLAVRWEVRREESDE